MSEVFGTVDNLAFQMGIRHTFISRAKCVLGTNSFPMPNAYLIQFLFTVPKCVFGTNSFPVPNAYLVQFLFTMPKLIRTVFSTVTNVFGKISIFCAKRIWHIFICLSKKTFGTLLHSL